MRRLDTSQDGSISFDEFELWYRHICTEISTFYLKKRKKEMEESDASGDGTDSGSLVITTNNDHPKSAHVGNEPLVAARATDILHADETAEREEKFEAKRTAKLKSKVLKEVLKAGKNAEKAKMQKAKSEAKALRATAQAKEKADREERKADMQRYLSQRKVSSNHYMKQESKAYLAAEQVKEEAKQSAEQARRAADKTGKINAICAKGLEERLAAIQDADVDQEGHLEARLGVMFPFDATGGDDDDDSED
jgi:flagellar biosynthesis GTPase FlhF